MGQKTVLRRWYITLLQLKCDGFPGNEGCGVWVMGGQPIIQVNQIYNNNNTGVAFTSDEVSVYVGGRERES